MVMRDRFQVCVRELCSDKIWECSLGVCVLCTLCGAPYVSNFTFFCSFCLFPDPMRPLHVFQCVFVLAVELRQLLSVSCVVLRRNLSQTLKKCALCC